MAQTTLGQLNVMVARLSIMSNAFYDGFLILIIKCSYIKWLLKSVPVNHLNRDAVEEIQ